MSIIIIAVMALVVGGAIGYSIFRYIVKGKYNELMETAKKDAEVVKEKKLLEVKETFLNKKAELETEVRQRNAKIQQCENHLKQRDLSLNQRQEDLGRRKQDLDLQQQRIANEQKLLESRQQELDKMQKQEQEKLEELSGLKAEEAKNRLVESLKGQAKLDAASYVNEAMDEARLNAEKEAKKIVITTIQRVATETAIENSVSVFHIDNDEVKGRIIGREGRNIRALEAATGVEIVVDDTPDAVVISAFDPVRREVCRLALHQLVADGRIHPARIEEVVAKVKKQLDNEIIETGKRTAIDLGIHGLHPELIRIIGKMKYRSSYGQNLLQHARETANLCAVMASELGLNPKKAKRAGLLHDIGKPSTTKIRKGRITSYAHDLEGAELALAFLSDLTDETKLAEKTMWLVRFHMQLLFVTRDMPFQDIPGMRAHTYIPEVALLSYCDRLGRIGADSAAERRNLIAFLEKCQERTDLPWLKET